MLIYGVYKHKHLGNNFVTNIKIESLGRFPLEYVQMSDYFSNYITFITEVKFTSGSLGRSGSEVSTLDL